MTSLEKLGDYQTRKIFNTMSIIKESVSIDDCFAMMDCMNSNSSIRKGHRYLESQSVNIFSPNFYLEHCRNNSILLNISDSSNAIILRILWPPEGQQRIHLCFVVYGIYDDLQCSGVQEYCKTKAVEVIQSFMWNNSCAEFVSCDLHFYSIKEEADIPDKNLLVLASCILAMKKESLR